MKEINEIIKSNGTSRIYHRETIDNLKPTTNHSLIYSRKQARDIFSRYPDVHLVEYVSGGRKTDSQIIGRGSRVAPDGCYVIISSTGGKWGKSRQSFRPVPK